MAVPTGGFVTHPLPRFKQFTAPISKRRQAALRQSDAIGAIMESVEARILLSTAPWQQSGEHALGTLKSLDGTVVMGSATLENGILTINGTAAGEEITLGTDWEDPTCFNVSIHSDTDGGVYLYNIADVRGIVVNAGDGDDCLDFLSFNHALNIRTTLNGDAGDDEISANYNARAVDHPDKIVDTTNVGTEAHGGAGNDYFDLSPATSDIYEGGEGNDLFVGAEGFDKSHVLPSAGNDIIRLYSNTGPHDYPVNPPKPVVPDPTPTTPTTPTTTTSDSQHTEVSDPPTVDQPTTAQPDYVVAVPAPAIGTPFSTNSVLTSDKSLWDA
jgi:hypothetical protein